MRTVTRPGSSGLSCGTEYDAVFLDRAYHAARRRDRIDPDRRGDAAARGHGPGVSPYDLADQIPRGPRGQQRRTPAPPAPPHPPPPRLTPASPPLLPPRP